MSLFDKIRSTRLGRIFIVVVCSWALLPALCYIGGALTVGDAIAYTLYFVLGLGACWYMASGSDD